MWCGNIRLRWRGDQDILGRQPNLRMRQHNPNCKGMSGRHLSYHLISPAWTFQAIHQHTGSVQDRTTCCQIVCLSSLESIAQWWSSDDWRNYEALDGGACDRCRSLCLFESERCIKYWDDEGCKATYKSRLAGIAKHRACSRSQSKHIFKHI